MIPMLLILVTFVFFVVHLMPGDPVEAMIGQNVPQEYKDQIKHNLGLDRPLFFNFRGSRARVKPDTLFLQTKPGLAPGSRPRGFCRLGVPRSGGLDETDQHGHDRPRGESARGG